jgi:N-acylneuraminate cytidylyltransferase
MDVRKIAIIPARGGSKRIPKKNSKDFLGKPIISYAIEAALQSNLFDEVMVSTDDSEIAEIAKRYGAKVPFFRSAKNADDFATTMDVLLEVLNDYEKRNYKFDYACCIYPCTPLLKVENLINSFQILKNENLDCVFPIVKYGFPIQRAVRINEKQLVEMFQREHLTTRSQDLEASYHDVGQFYFFDVQKLMEKQQLLTDNTGFIELSEMESQDIDTISDWELAEFKYQFFKNKE